MASDRSGTANRVRSPNHNGGERHAGTPYSVYNTVTGAKLGTLQEVNSGDGQPFPGDGGMVSTFHASSASPIPQQVTVKDSLGSSVTVPVVRVAPYN